MDNAAQLYEKLYEKAESAGYQLNPAKDHTVGLVEGLIQNQGRYGYWACPCRLADGEKEEDEELALLYAKVRSGPIASDSSEVANR